MQSSDTTAVIRLDTEAIGMTRPARFSVNAERPADIQPPQAEQRDIAQPRRKTISRGN
jgi:hypothetical protein